MDDNGPHRLGGILLAGLAGATALLAFQPIGWWPIAWVCLVPLLPAGVPDAWNDRLARGYAFGVAFFGGGLAWLPESIGRFAGFSVAASWGATGVIVAFLALFPAVFTYLVGAVGCPRWRLLAFAPSLWVVLEVVRAQAWGGLPWLDLAATQVAGPLAAWLPLVDSTGVTALVVLINAGFALLAGSLRGVSPHALQRFGLVAPVVLVAALGLATFAVTDLTWVRPSGPTIPIGMVQAGRDDAHALTQRQASDMAATYRRLAKSVLPPARLVVLPESAVQTGLGQWREAFEAELDEGRAFLIGAAEKTLGGDRYNSAFLIHEQGRGRYRKQRPVPIGESRPPWLVAGWIDGGGPASGTVLPGDRPLPLVFSGLEIGPLICWEVRFPAIAMQQTVHGANLLINPANESWLQSQSAQSRSLAAARLRAAATGRPLVRVTNAGLSAVIGPSGAIQARIPTGGPWARVARVQPTDGQTPASVWRAYSNLPLVALGVILVTPLFGAGCRPEPNPSPGKCHGHPTY